MATEEKDKLESLVPSEELCKQIPIGSFTDSALVYVKARRSLKPYIELRDAAMENALDILYPAPLAEEIMEELVDRYGDVALRRYDNRIYKTSGWMFVKELSPEAEWYGYNKSPTEFSDNPANASLKLWFRIIQKGEVPHGD